MLNFIKIYPNTTINDHFVIDGSINASPVRDIDYKHPLITGNANDLKTRYQAGFYKYIAVDLVVETVLNYPYPYISEKTLRPIACKRMFIVLGAQNTLALLKSKGFETFNDIIDESYDNIQNAPERFKAVEKQIYKICNTPLPVIKKYMTENAYKFEHNFKTLSNLQETELQQIAKDHDIKI